MFLFKRQNNIQFKNKEKFQSFSAWKQACN